MKKKFALLLCLFMIVAAKANAQESEEEKEPISLIQKTKDAFKSESFQLSGYGQMAYSLNEEPVGGANNSFNIVRALVFAMGKLGTNNQFGYMLMYDFGPNPMLHELYGEWMPCDALNVRFGQFKIPFTIENPMSPTRIETINFSRSGTAMSGSVGDFNEFNQEGESTRAKAGRDAGFQLSGKLFPNKDFSLVEYYAGLFNGTGLNTRDNNNHKDFIGTVYLQPIKGLRIGGSLYSGQLYRPMNGMPAANHTRDRWTIGAEYAGKKFYGRSEYIAANDGGLKRNGYYGSAVWKIVPDKWEVLGKYDFYDANTNINNNEIKDITAGVNYYFAYLSRIQLNYIYTDDKANGKNNGILAQLQLFF